MMSAKKIPKLSFWQIRNIKLNCYADFVHQVSLQHGDIFKLPWTAMGYYVFNNEASIRHILLTNKDNFTKQETFYNRIRFLGGQGLLTNDGDSWRAQRQQLQPFFHEKRIYEYEKAIQTEIQNHIPQLRALCHENKPFDLFHEMLSLMLKITGQVLFTTDLDEDCDDFVRNVAVFNRQIVESTVIIPWWIPNFRNIRFHRALKKAHRVVDKIIEHRKAQQNPPDDLLNIIMNAKGPDKVTPISEQHIFDEVFTLLITGHETLGTCLTWVWYLISQNPLARTKLQDELQNVLNGRLPGLDDLPNLPYTKAVIQEAMRLYPPVWITVRKSIKEDMIDGFYLPENASLMFCNYAIHRHPTYWEQPDEFIPERFLTTKPSYSKYTYLPFGGGPRICIARHFAMIQAQLVIASLAQLFNFEYLPNYPLQLSCYVTLKPGKGLIVKGHDIG